GTLSAEDYGERVLPYSRRILEGLTGVPRIHFAVGASHLLKPLRDAGADVVGLDWRVPLDEAPARLRAGGAAQGDLDPAAGPAPHARTPPGPAGAVRRHREPVPAAGDHDAAGRGPRRRTQRRRRARPALPGDEALAALRRGGRGADAGGRDRTGGRHRDGPA